MIVQTSQGQTRLINEVINNGLCVRCGACAGFCPYFDYIGGKIIPLAPCCSDTARCFQICPLAEHGEKNESDESGIGDYRKIFVARSTDPEIVSRAQYGGVVSTLMIYALEKGEIKAAVLTSRGNGSSPAGFLAESRGDILSCSGSEYTGSGGLSALNRALKAGKDMLGIVGLPCQMEAVRRMSMVEFSGENLSAPISLKIALFCTWALDHRAFDDFLVKNMDGGKIIKYDIPPPPSEKLVVQTLKRKMEYPLSDIRPFIQQGCLLCEDMTGETADLSVGTLEGSKSWNTLIVRTQRGEDLLAGAVKQGLLEVAEFPDENFNHLMEASENKRNRGRKRRIEKNK